MNLVIDDAIVDYVTGVPVHLNLKGEVAVVGSSGNLLKRELGAVIDRHDIVIRMNDAPTKGYHKHVGAKTTIRVVAHNALRPAMFSLLKETQYLIIWGAPQHYQKIVPMIKKIKMMYPGLAIYRLSQKAMQLNDAEYEARTGKNRLASGAWLSTGWFSIFIAFNLKTGNDITVCGYGCMELQDEKVAYHYYEQSGKKQAQYVQQQQSAQKGHRFLDEATVFKLWAGIKFI